MYKTTHEIAGIAYQKPQVILLQETGIGTSEVAARTCYDSFDKSENAAVKAFDSQLNTTITHGLEFPSLSGLNQTDINHVNKIEESDLLGDLAWTYFHHSVLEHANLTFLIKGTSRGVLQEHARHRIQAISVRSTRYTMSPVINAFIAEILNNNSNTNPSDWFYSKLLELSLFVTTDEEYNKIQIDDIWRKLKKQYSILGEEAFLNITTTRDSRMSIGNRPSRKTIFSILQGGKKKRNVGDAFKHIVNDNWKIDMVVTMNLRAYKNYLGLRAVGSAWFQIQWLSVEMIKATPRKYLDLIMKQDAINKHIS